MQVTRTLIRGLKVMEAVVTSEDPISAPDVANQVDLDRATVLRLLHTLDAAGYVFQANDGRYGVTGKILYLANVAELAPLLQRTARPHLERLSGDTKETVHLGVLDGIEGIYIDKIDGTHPVRLVSAVGEKLPLHSTGLGKAALAWMSEEELTEMLGRIDLVRRTENTITDPEALRRDLAEAREREFAIDRAENEEHVCCVAAPILAPDGTVSGMISVSGPSYRVETEIDELGKLCRNTAQVVAREFFGITDVGEERGSVVST